MSLVPRAPLTNYLNKMRHGIVKFISKKGISVDYDENRRPVGNSQGQPDTRRATKEVIGDDKAKFGNGKEIRRNSVYRKNNSGDSGQKWDGPRSRTKE